MKDYCSKCNKIMDVGVKKKIEKFTVKGEPIEQENDVVYCLTCGEEIFNEEYDSKNLERAYDEYRKKHNLLTSNDIKEIRKKYGLSQKDFARILGFGEVTITRYENGTIQDKANDNLMQMARNEETFINLLKNSTLENYEKGQILLRLKNGYNFEEVLLGNGKPLSTFTFEETFDIGFSVLAEEPSKMIYDMYSEKQSVNISFESEEKTPVPFGGFNMEAI